MAVMDKADQDCDLEVTVDFSILGHLIRSLNSMCHETLHHRHLAFEKHGLM